MRGVVRELREAVDMRGQEVASLSAQHAEGVRRATQARMEAAQLKHALFKVQQWECGWLTGREGGQGGERAGREG